MLVDTNILMYWVGHEHPNRAPCLRFLGRVAAGEIDATIDSETLQEILHRYRSIGRWKDGARAYDYARQLFRTVLPVTAETADGARHLMDEIPALKARDAIHAAVCIQNAGGVICSYDTDFDVIPGVKRIEPEGS